VDRRLFCVCSTDNPFDRADRHDGLECSPTSRHGSTRSDPIRPEATGDGYLLRPGDVSGVPERLTRPDGRRLGYEIMGAPAPDAATVVYLHGTPGSRISGRLLDPTATDRGNRLVAPDRPGMGLSTHDPDRRIDGVADDVAALADALDADRVGVVGHSGGGPYALACAARIPERLAGVVVVSGVPHPAVRSRGAAVDAAVGLLGAAPWLARPPLAVVARLVRERPALFVGLLRRRAAPPDRAVLEDARVAETLEAALTVAFAGGTRGPALDAALLGDPARWGFEPADVEVPVVVHHGTRDRTVPVDDARRLVDTLPCGHLRVHDGEGHLSTLVRNPGRILAGAVGGT
jgi:pimeloyl-ACP methyl ester carboxylesterase